MLLYHYAVTFDSISSDFGIFTCESKHKRANGQTQVQTDKRKCKCKDSMNIRLSETPGMIQCAL